MTTSNDKIESMIVAAKATAPRITPQDLEANIVHTEVVKHVTHSGKILRWAVLTTRNGFAVTGKPSASVSIENDREEIGTAVAVQNAKDCLWDLMAYELQSLLHAAKA